MSPEEFVSRAIMVPFVDHGRDWQGWDCWGLVRVFYREVLGVDLPSHDAGYETAGDTPKDREAIQLMMSGEAPLWQSVEVPVAGDIVLLRCFGRPVHVGAVIDRSRFLHAEKRLGTVVESFNSSIWSRRIEGKYRLKCLT